MNIPKFPPPTFALAAALLFGASTPASKLLTLHMNSQLLAGLLYLGSGTGLLIYFVVASSISKRKIDFLKRSDLPWLGAAIAFGGVAGPLFLMIGLTSTTGSAASLLLNLEAVLTGVVAWVVFKEHTDRKIVFGMVAIVLGSVLLSVKPDSFVLSSGSIWIIAACLCWAIDNNVTRNISQSDPVQIAALKGLTAGLVNCSIALSQGAHLPGPLIILAAGIVGLLGYGISLVLFIMSLRYIGTGRSGAYFSTAPFAGAVASLLILHEPLTLNLILAAICMIAGLWLHLTESHEHEHFHPAIEHEHEHTHDEHHKHQHDSGQDSTRPHTHLHKHLPISHSHNHFPDTEHRHQH